MPDTLPTSRPARSGLFSTSVFVGIALSLVSANPELTVTAIVLAYVLVKLLWRQGEPPVLLFALGFQWVQASILIFYADLQNQALADLGADTLEAGGDSVAAATWLTLIGLLAVGLGARLGAGSRAKTPAAGQAAPPGAQFHIPRLFYASLAAMAISSVLTKLSFIVPGLSEPVRGFVLVRWVIYYLLAYTVFSERRGYPQLAIVLAAELLVGFLGFFSDFRAVLIMTLMAAMALPYARLGIRLRGVVAIVVLTLTLGVVWQSIKSDYRDFMNQGSAGQEILVSRADQISELATLIGNLTPERLGEGARGLVYRIQFVNFFGAVIGMVPTYIPYEDGKLWWQAIEHVMVPRLFNPNKPVINDSDRTAEYSGLNVARGEQGTSISMGYIAESYIDFGPVLMMPALFVWGIFVGWIYRVMVRPSKCPPFAYGCAAALITQNAALVEQSNLKMVGSVLVGLIALYLVQKYFAEKLIGALSAPATSAQIGSIDKPQYPNN